MDFLLFDLPTVRDELVADFERHALSTDDREVQVDIGSGRLVRGSPSTRGSKARSSKPSGSGSTTSSRTKTDNHTALGRIEDDGAQGSSRLSSAIAERTRSAADRPRRRAACARALRAHVPDGAWATWFQTLAGAAGGLLGLGTVAVTLLYTVTSSARLELVRAQLGGRLQRLFISCMRALLAGLGVFCLLSTWT